MDSLKSSICWIVVLFIADVSSTGLSSHRTSETNKIPWDILLDPNHRKPILNQTSRFTQHLPENLLPSYPMNNPAENYKIPTRKQKIQFPGEANSKPNFTNVATFRPKQKFAQFSSNHFYNQQEKQGKRRRGDRRKQEKRKQVESGEKFFSDYDDFESVNQHNFGYPHHLIPSTSDSNDYFTKAKDFIKLGSYGNPSYSSPDISDNGYGYAPPHDHGYSYQSDHSYPHPGLDHSYPQPGLDHIYPQPGHDYSEDSYYPYKSKNSKYVAFALGLLPLGLLLASLVPTIVTIPVSTAVATGRRKKRSDCMQKNLQNIIHGFC